MLLRRGGGVIAMAVQRKPFLLPACLRFPLCSLPVVPPVCHYHSSCGCPVDGTAANNRWNSGEQRRAEDRTRKQKQQQLQELAQGAGGRLQAGTLSNVLEEMERAGVRAEEKVLQALLKRCKQERNLKAAQLVHAHLHLSTSDRRVLSRLVASLISVYGACGRLDLARSVFRQQQQHQRGKENKGRAAMWNAMMQACTQCGGEKDALQLFQEMEEAGVPADAFTFSTVLKACAMAEDLEMGKRVHAEILRKGLHPNTVLSNTLINMYGTCGEMEEARAVFQGMKERDVVTWTAMIAGETQSGRGEEALRLFQEMEEAGIPANSFTFAAVLKACAMTGDMEMGKRVHAKMLHRGSLSIVEANALISMYGKCGKMEEARAVFQGMKERNVVTWTTMIVEEAQSGHGQEALQLFQEMEEAGVAANAFTFSIVLKACASTADLKTGKQVHAELLRKGLQLNTALSNALINMYGTCGEMEEARAVFQGMKERDVVTWTTMIAEETQSGHEKEALQLFQEMQEARVPANAATFAAVLKACAMTKNVTTGKRVHAKMLHRGSLSVVEANALISMYGKCGKMEEARAVFQGMKERDVVTWNSMIAEETQGGDGKKALQLFQEMQEAGIPANSFTFAAVLKACAMTGDMEMGKRVHAKMLHRGSLSIVEANALISMYGKCGKMEEARAVFQGMKERDVVTWNSMIAEETQGGDGKKALQLFQEMQQAGVPADTFTFSIVLKACASTADLKTGKQVHAELLRKGLLPNINSSNALISMYGKCGELEAARAVFQQMKERDVITWTTMISMLGLHGQGKEALATLQEMQEQGVEPDAITFVNVLNACSHAGLVEEGLACFAAMSERHNVQPTTEHFNCIVDLLGRAGRLAEAETLIRTMASPDAVTWKALLGACRGAKDVDRAKRAAERAIALDPKDAAPFVVLSNILAAAGRWEEAEKVRKEMEERRVKKEPGRSWITVDGEVHSFVVKDRSHPRSAEIYHQLDRLNQQMKAAGYQPDLNWVLHDVADEQKAEELCYHSEKLAIAFGLVATPPGQPLRILKNLRVCGDCHTATKFIAKVSQREILVRDANRFHRFSPDGLCSCGDYW
ncbi:Pentatricopeptide repeat-containing protein [Balamuthia mandrillaris]